VVPNTSSEVNSPRTEAGKQFTFTKEVRSVASNSGGYRHAPQTQAVAARTPQSASGPTPRGPSSTNAPAPQHTGNGVEHSANNKVTLTGRLGQDAVVRHTKKGCVVANFSVAVDESYKDLLGEWHKKTAWHRVQVWEELAETVRADLQKGVRVYVEGRVVNRMWIDRENRQHNSTEVVASDVRFLDAAPKREARNGSEFREGYRAGLQ
jgi:single-strand DNA-binding protein